MRDAYAPMASGPYPQAYFKRCTVGPAGHLHYLVDHYSVLDICQVICTEERSVIYPAPRHGLPYARRSAGTCQSTPGVGKHYQHYDEDCHYLRYCDEILQCGPWRHDYPRRSYKEVEHTNNDSGPVAPLF